MQTLCIDYSENIFMSSSLLCPVYEVISKLFGINNSHNKTMCQVDFQTAVGLLDATSPVNMLQDVQ